MEHSIIINGTKEVQYEKWDKKSQQKLTYRDNVAFNINLVKDVDQLIIRACRTQRNFSKYGPLQIFVKKTRTVPLGISKTYIEVEYRELEKLIKKHYKKNYDILRGEQSPIPQKPLKFSIQYNQKNPSMDYRFQAWLDNKPSWTENTDNGWTCAYILKDILQDLVNKEVIIEGDYLIYA
jgi:hypothetical protein